MRIGRIVGILGMMVGASAAHAAEPALAAADRFEKKIRPLLAARCWQCHGPVKTQGWPAARYGRSDRRRRRFGASRCAGQTGREPADRGDRLRGRAEDAAERKAQRRRDHRADLMGPCGRRLARCRTHDGAPPTAGAGGPLFTREQKSFWAFQPPRDPVPPGVKATDWPKSPLDRFILAELERNGLTPAPPADRRT